MKILYLLLLSFVFFCGAAYAQNSHDVTGSVVDTAKMSIPGASVKIKTDLGDSSIRVINLDGKFSFKDIKANKITLTVTSIGYQGIIKHFTFANDNKPLNVGNIILRSASKMLNGVTIVGITPVTLKEDTTQYSAAAYKVRENAPVEDLVKKLPGIDVDKDGNITTKGKQVTKIRINGKDVFGGDVQSITKNLPADVVENIQMIDDYGDAANLTGVKTGEPNQIMNINIRKDKNYGYSVNTTGGAGRDGLPSVAAIPPSTASSIAVQAPKNDTRYVGMINAFKFKGNQQLYILGNFNNANLNTFSFGGSGGGRGRRSGGTQDGITDVHTGGVNYRDQWGKKLSVYGSYSFADNTTNIITSSKQSNISTEEGGPTSNQSSNETDDVVNHRFTWNMEYKPDTLNYLKFTPSFSYSSTKTDYRDEVYRNSKNTDTVHYKSTSLSTVTAPNIGLNVLFNHRFNATRRNLNVYVTAGSTHNNQDQNPIYYYLKGTPTAPINQLISTGSRTDNVGTTFSYLEPVSKRGYLELNYAYNYSHTNSEKETDTLFSDNTYRRYDLLSNDYRYNFITNKAGLNYRFIEQKYNFTVGVGAQPAQLEGFSPTSGVSTKVTTFNIIPTARYIYNFSRNSSFSVNYNGSSNQPTFDQLQPVTDFSNALYPVRGNPDLNPEFTNNIDVRYNRFSFDKGDVFFFHFSYTKTDNKIVTNSIIYPSDYSDPKYAGTILTNYLNADGYHNTHLFFTYSKPWAERKFTLSITNVLDYSNNIGYITSITPVTFTSTTEKNIGKNLVMTPYLRFRTDIDDVIDAQFSTSYSINKTDNSLKNNLTQASANVRAWNIGLNGKNYFWKNWTLSYDLTKTFNKGYTVAVTNPNILNVYVERRFLKNNMATIRVSGNDLFNQNAGYSLTSTPSSLTEKSVNRLGRYFMLTLNIRLQKFAGKSPDMNMPDGREHHYHRSGGGGGFGPQ